MWRNYFPSLLSLAFLFGFIALSIYFVAPDSLKRGQSIKQAYTHSISQSINSKGISKILSTEIPCPNPLLENSNSRLWVEEPPVFHIVAALLSKIGLQKAWHLPLLISLLAWPLLYFIFAQYDFTRNQRFLYTNFAFFSPLWVRYSMQHIPDTLAVLFLLASYLAIVKKRFNWFYFFAVFSITTKALCVFPIFAFWLMGPFKEQTYNFRSLIRKKSVIHSLAFLGCLLPFSMWLWLIHNNSIPNPFFSISVDTKLRHTGTWSLLLQLDYWSRFVTWNFVKGCGLIALIIIIKSIYQCRDKKISNRVPIHLFVCAFMLIPYWIFIRNGNYVHDYYALPFVFPLMIIAAHGLQFISSTRLRSLIMICSIVVALTQVHSLSKNRAIEVDFCKSEESQFIKSVVQP